ncbi:MAG: PAN domain-containing protein, partial [Paracoccaceae bacterium]
MRRIFLTAVLFVIALAGPAPAQQQSPVPARHIAVSRDVDFPGGDIRTLFDTSFQACRRACLSDDQCAAFTFNTRSNACFPKRGVNGREPYQGALSATVIPTDPAVLSMAGTRRAELGFLDDTDMAAARDLAEALPTRHYVNDWTADALLSSARAARGRGNLTGALSMTGAALTLTDAADQWVEYADLSLAIETDDRGAKRSHAERAMAGSINGYLRTASAPTRANALLVMSRALERLERGRDMIPALRLAQSLAPRDDTAAALEDAIGKYGFRIVEHKVDSDAAEPRICAVFSGDLIPAGTDYAPYVQLPEPGLTVTQDGQQLCVDGVEHGQRYRVTFRKGLPAQSGEALNKDVTLTLYVKDRAPSVRFPGRAYVLPKAGAPAVPIVTVNTDTVNLTLRRVSDRNLLRVMQNDYFGRPLSKWEQDDFGNDIAEE